MTYRQKLLLKRFLIILAIVIAVLAIAWLIFFTYLGREVVYTEDGAYFAFRSQAPDASADTQLAAAPESPVLVTGDSIRESSALEDNTKINLSANEIGGLFLSYSTLCDDAAMSTTEISDELYNTLVLELRVSGSEILNNDNVSSLIQQAQAQNLRLTAMISCLDDSAYALAHTDSALQISGGALWMSDSGSYWLNPADETVQTYLSGMIAELAGMGFQEVILNNFTFPESTSIEYTSDSTRAELLQDAYEALEEAAGLDCDLGILVKDTEIGHQAFDIAQHLYIYYTDGSSVKEYVENHPDYYLVFVTSSHDTRFDDYGKIYTDEDVSYFSSLPSADTSEGETDTDTDTGTDTDTDTEADAETETETEPETETEAENPTEE